ncbi:MAG: hypothetical protein ABJ013_08815 [Halioglobus sp.]
MSPFQDRQQGIAIATLVWAALLPAALSILLRLDAIPFAALIATIAFWCLFILPERYLMFRAQNVAVIATVGITLLMVNKKYWLLSFSVFLFNHAYQGVILVGAAGFAYLIANYYVSRNIDLKAVIFSLAGFTLSLLSSPWFPDNISYFVSMMLGRLISPFDDIDLLGSEWLRLDWLTLVEYGLVAHLCVIFSMIVIIASRKEVKANPSMLRLVSFYILSLIFLLLYARHWRMGEFYGPIAAITFGCAIASLRNAHGFLVKCAITTLAVITIAHQIYASPPLRLSAQPTQLCETVRKYTPANHTIFNLSWSRFTELYYCTSEPKYVSGLDGLLLMLGNPLVFEAWYLLRENATETLNPAEVERLFLETRTRFVVLQPEHTASHAWIIRHIRGATLVPTDEEGGLIGIDLSLLSDIHNTTKTE